MPDPLTPDQLSNALATLPGWNGNERGISKTFRFADFLSAMRFMHNIAPAIDANNHHPEWRNVYNSIEVTLRTHDAGDRVTQRDIALAQLLEDHFKQTVR